MVLDDLRMTVCGVSRAGIKAIIGGERGGSSWGGDGDLGEWWICAAARNEGFRRGSPRQERQSPARCIRRAVGDRPGRTCVQWFRHASAGGTPSPGIIARVPAGEVSKNDAAGSGIGRGSD